ncbi:hypothetical protein FACS189438_0990 [Bacteroidia bacterium]|nr:hypothetical protein FACS189438_0990 [Bacteroidia bacterium]
MKELILPALIELFQYDGNFELYNNAVYEIFKNDFVLNKPVYEGKKLRLKARPYMEGKEYTYYHFTHSGDDESERTPDLRRMERIGFPKPMIDASRSDKLKTWRNRRGTKDRILILHEEEKYLVVLEDRKDYILPWTAYLIEHESRLKRLVKEYEEYKKTETA